ncbi:MAG TPA: YggS family pyridoxal phosphate-dependent enzyme [Phycisphaerae bacterium]|nr:YggS family pyridoxal phosphate-dependent enzyme [Phycisphaerae bacterium]
MERSDAIRRLRDNLERVRETIADACRRAGRDPAAVRLVAVTKYVDLDMIGALLDVGVHELGENRVQQLVQRAERVGATMAELFGPEPERSGPGDRPPDASAAVPRWHMIGHLQRNKVKTLLGHTRIIHSLDSPRLAREIQKVAEARDLMVDTFVEVNVAEEESKYGVALPEVEAVAEAVGACDRIRLRGLMTMAPFDPDPEAARPHFARLRELLERLRQGGAVGPDCAHLSMGMTQDYGVAVEEGATFVRIGSALYEEVSQVVT